MGDILFPAVGVFLRTRDVKESRYRIQSKKGTENGEGEQGTFRISPTT